MALVSCVPAISDIEISPHTVAKFEELDAAYPSWSPDGKQIAFLDRSESGHADFGGYLAVINLSTRAVTRLNDEEVYYDWLRWSPDSKQLVVVDEHDIWLVNVADGKKQELPIKGIGAAWAPDGKSLAIFQDPQSSGLPDHFEIVLVTLQGEILRRIFAGAIDRPAPTPTPAPTPLDSIASPISDPRLSAPRFAGLDWSPDGQNIVYSIVHPEKKRSDIIVTDANGTGLNSRIYAGMGKEPVWSPDGTRIAYISGESEDLFVTTPSGDCQMRLTQSDYYMDYPSWSSDSRQIAVHAYGTFFILDVQALLGDGNFNLEKCRR